MGSRYDLAVITGGSSGIGYSIIEGLFKVEPDCMVFNLSRRIPASFPGSPNLHHIECDLADRDHRSNAYSTLERSVCHASRNGRILLINNAGFGLYGAVDTGFPSDHLELIEVNVSALVELTTLLLPKIKHQGGSILNIASTAAFQPTPNLATYGASKAFVLNWTLALNEELRGTPANAIAICPGPTRTDFFKRAGIASEYPPGGFSHSSEQVAKIALEALDDSSPFKVTGALNKIMTVASSLLPLGLRTRVAGKIISRFRQNPNQD